MNENEYLLSLGQSAPVGNLSELKKQVGFRRAYVSYLARCLYMIKLWLLRENAILLTLIENYEKIPTKTFSRLFIGLLKKLSFPKKLISSNVRRLQNTFTNNI